MTLGLYSNAAIMPDRRTGKFLLAQTSRQPCPIVIQYVTPAD